MTALAVAAVAGPARAAALLALGHPVADRGLVLRPCSADARAPCWAEAAVAERFAPPPGRPGAALEAEVRLAWSPGDGALLVRVPADLPPGARVEAALGWGRDDVRLARSDLVVAPAGGVAELRPGTPLRAGDRRPLRLAVVLPDGDGGARALPWSPGAGPGDPDRPGLVLAVRDPGPPPPPPEVSLEGDRLVVSAPGARIRVEADGPLTPARPPFFPEPWSAAGDDLLVAAPPAESGWLHVVAEWPGRHLALLRAWLQAEPGPEAALAGLHPAPRLARLDAEAPPFRLPADPAFCAEGPFRSAVADLFAEEIERLAGRRPRAAAPGEPCALRLLPLDAADGLGLDAEARAVAGEPGGFAIVVRPGLAAALAADRAAAARAALALADLVGPDAVAPALVAADAPDLPLRLLHHRVNLRGGTHFDADAWVAMLRRVAVRGRFTLLTLDLMDGLRSRTHPEIALPNAIDDATLQRLLAAARGVGIELAPGLDWPGHAEWLLRSHPELAEDAAHNQVCTRDPRTWAILDDLVGELLERFGHPGWFHVGHDEIGWRTEQAFDDERCPRCAGTPRWELLREDLERTAELLDRHGVRGIVYDDMLVPGWHGDRLGTPRAPTLLSPRARRVLAFAAWSPLGDPLHTLADAEGLDVIRQHTGYRQHKRAGLVHDRQRLAGEGIGLFTPVPWSAFLPTPGSRALQGHWTVALLAGATAWRADLSETPTETLLSSAGEWPAYLPGYRHPPGWGGRSRPLRLHGAAPGPAFDLVLRRRAELLGVGFRLDRPAEARAGAPVRIAARGPAAAISLLLAVHLDHDAENALRARREDLVARLVVELADGRTVEREVRYGLDAWRPEGPGRPMWRSAGMLGVASRDAARSLDRARDRWLWRVDWLPPEPGARVRGAELRVERPGVAVLVAGAAMLPPGDGGGG